MKYAVDQTIDNVVLLENINTKEKIIIKKEEIPFPIHDGSIIRIENGELLHDIEEEKKRKEIIRKKINQIRKEQNEDKTKK